ncbi:MAG: DUF1203 domain-containing protein [Hyphomonadaceae bacterium]|nr:DUF1203 domain-containing protein [Hyphomonadaceae bacterium]
MRAQGIPTAYVERIRRGGADANGDAPVRKKAVGMANPCRHCLGLIAEGEEMLVLSYRPFEADQPYAERGPIFLHARGCARYDAASPPAWFAFLDPAAVRAYDAQHWIRYDAAEIVSGRDICATCAALLNMEGVAYVHVRSKFGCFQCRVDRDHAPSDA